MTPRPLVRLTPRGRVALAVACAVLAVLSVVAVASLANGGGFGLAKSTSPPTGQPPGSPTPSQPSSQPSTPNASASATASAALTRLVSGAPGRGAFVTALNTRTGAHFTAGTNAGNWTASCYKLVLLEILLLQNQQQGSSLSDGETGDATTAIENSDNVAGYQLWIDVGRNPGMQAALPTLGMRHAVAQGSDPTFTRLTPPDTIALLDNLVNPKSPLNAQSRAFTLGLMHNVEDDQRWGAGAAADPHTDFANKNGWLSIDNDNGPGEADDGLWVVNSLGILTIGGDQVLLAAFSEHDPSFDAGVRLIESMAKGVRPLVGG